MRQYIAAGIRLVVHLARLKGGVRRITRVSQIVGIENGEYHIEDVFSFCTGRIDESGRATGEFHALGYRPACVERFATAGIDFAEERLEKRVLD